jgi:hypothetical protein
MESRHLRHGGKTWSLILKCGRLIPDSGFRILDSVFYLLSYQLHFLREPGSGIYSHQYLTTGMVLIELGF